MLACICGGIVELGLFGACGVIVMIVNMAVNRYNRRKCCKENCCGH